MARATNLLTQGISGKLGGLVFRQQPDGMPAVVAVAPGKRGRKPRRGEAANQNRFRLAAAYARGIRRDRELALQYLAARTERLRSAYHVALADALNPPKLLGYDVPGGLLGPGQVLRVQATDDFGVVRVLVRVEGPEGELLEEGPAAAPAPGTPAEWWRYTVQGSMPAGARLVATAEDRPGNVAIRHWELP